MSNILCSRRNSRWIRHHTNSIIANDDAETHATLFSQHSRVFKMSIASSRFEDPEPSIIGYFQYTWGGTGVIPKCNNTAIAFSGWADPATALSESSNASLNGDKYISLGGGYGSDGTPNAGKFTQTVLNAILTAINNGNFSNYKGILFDVEYIDTTGLTSQSAMYPLFQSIFAAAKSKGLKVIVCVGHSGNITDVAGSSQYTQLMTDFLSDANVDYVSPQLYANGNENPPQYNANGLPWSAWAASGKPIIFAIPWAQQYECVEAWAKQQFNPNQLSGFLQWNNTTYSGGTSCSILGNLNSIQYGIYNNSSWICIVRWNGTGDIFNGNINPNGGSASGSSDYGDSDTITMSFVDPNNLAMTYTATFTYSNTGNPTASFQASTTAQGYIPLKMVIYIPSLGVNQPIFPNSGNSYQLANYPMSDGDQWTITFNDNPYQALEYNLSMINNTDLIVYYNGTGYLTTPGIINRTTSLYDMSNPITSTFFGSWFYNSATFPVPAPATSNMVLLFNACPAPGLPCLSIDTGTNISIFKATTFSMDVTVNGNVFSNILVGSGVQPLLAISDIQQLFNGSTILDVTIQFNDYNIYSLLNNYVFTNNTPYTISVTSTNISIPANTTIAADASQTFNEIIVPYNNYLSPPNPLSISWNALTTSYTGTCVTSLNTSNSGTGSVFTFDGGNTTGITTTLTYNGAAITADQYGSIALAQSSMALPPPANVYTPNVYAITLTAAAVTNCDYTLNITNSTSYVMTINYDTTSYTINNNGQTTPIEISVAHLTTLSTSIQWDLSHTSFWGGPSIISIACNGDGTGSINDIDRGYFIAAYQPKMIATVSSNPTVDLEQTSNTGGSQWNTYPVPLPATGGSISLVFSDP